MNSELGKNEEIHGICLFNELLSLKFWYVCATMLNLCSNLEKKNVICKKTLKGYL